jgi:hypothetical protein
MADMTVKTSEGPWFSNYNTPGEYQATAISEQIGIYAPGESWQTFCVDPTEYVVTKPGTVYRAEISTTISNHNPQLDGRALNPMTAYLYSNFIGETLPGYDFDNSNNMRVAHGVALQHAIFAIEGVGGFAYGSLNSKGQEFYDAAMASGWTTLGNVRVLNVYTTGSNDPLLNMSNHNNNGYRQDFLVTVPAPGAALLGSMGLGMLGWVRRRLA